MEDPNFNQQVFVYTVREQQLCQWSQLLPTWIEDTESEQLTEYYKQIRDSLLEKQPQFKQSHSVLDYLLRKLIVMANQTPFPEAQHLLTPLITQISKNLAHITLQDYEILLEKYCRLISTEETPSYALIGRYLRLNPKDNDEDIGAQKDAKLLIMKNLGRDQLGELFKQILNFFFGRIPNLYRPLLFFPDFLKNLHDLVETVFFGVSKSYIDQDLLFVISFLSFAAHQNDYLFNLFAEIVENMSDVELPMTRRFLTDGIASLSGQALNSILLIQSFVQNVEVFKESYPQIFKPLLHPTNDQEKYNIREVAVIMLLLSLVQQLNTFTSALKLLPEIDFHSTKINKNILNFIENLSLSPTQKTSSASVDLKHETQQKHNEEVLGYMTTEFIQDGLRGLALGEEARNSKEENKGENEFFPQEGDDQNLSDSKSSDSSFSIDEELDLNSVGTYNFQKYFPTTPGGTWCDKGFLTEPKTKTDQKNKSNARRLLTYQEFDFKKGVYQFFQQHLSQNLAQQISNQRLVCKNMTCGTFGDFNDIDTSKFRECVWNYSFLCLGYIRECVNKKLIEQMLKPGTKQFIRKALLQSCQITRRDYENISFNLATSDIVHMLCLISEIQFIAQMTFSFYSLILYREKAK